MINPNPQGKSLWDAKLEEMNPGRAMICLLKRPRALSMRVFQWQSTRGDEFLHGSIPETKIQMRKVEFFCLMKFSAAAFHTGVIGGIGVKEF